MKGFFKNGCPIVKLNIQEKEIDILLDTGFNGHIMLPQEIINKLNLEQIGFSDFSTASGEEHQTNVYKAKIKFFEDEIEIPVISTNSSFALAGMDLFHYCSILIERHKEIVEINKL